MSSAPRKTLPSSPSPSPPGWAGAMVARLTRSLGLVPMSSDPDPTVPAGLAARESPVPSGLQVLVVDDDPSNLTDACKLLERLGISARSAVDGVQAVALARTQDFDLILMDLQMPVIDGLAATMQIRAREKARSRPRAPVVAYTSFALADELMRGCGMDGVLSKPCSENALQECLLRWCGPQRGAMHEAPTEIGVRALR